MTVEGTGMWLRLDDHFATHPKVVGLTDRAFRCHVNAMVYAAEHLTDGAIPDFYVKADRKSAAELEAARLWERNGKGWVIHDWLDWNPSAESVQKRRAEDRERKRRYRRGDDGRYG
jgi:hypothetical protein